MKKQLSEQEKIDWIRLSRSENVGPVTFRTLLALYQTPTKALPQLQELAAKGGSKKKITVCSEREAEKELAATEKLGGRIVASCEDDYPEILKTLPDAPPVITLLGQISLLTKPALAIVGTRNASFNGKNLTRQLSFAVSEKNYAIISGMARGIDSAAHEGALEGKGGTIAVLGTGIDVVYPSENEALYQRIKQEGLLISELPLGTQPFVGHFPRRNRLISGLSQGVLVIEAHTKSGSLITAQYAADQGRDVYAVPGFPLDPRAQGPNRLLKDGAILVQNADDIFAVLEHTSPFALKDSFQQHLAPIVIDEKPTQTDLEAATEQVLENLGAEAIEIDHLIRETHLTASVVHIVLMQLELAGKVERYPGNRVSLVMGK